MFEWDIKNIDILERLYGKMPISWIIEKYGWNIGRHIVKRKAKILGLSANRDEMKILAKRKPLINGQKQCCRCKEIKNLNEFHPKKHRVDGVRPECKDCSRIMRKECRHRRVEKNDYNYKVFLERDRKRSIQKHYLIKNKIIEYYGGRCIECGIDKIDVLTIDHINNDGNIYRKNNQVRNNFYKWIIKNNFPDNLQILCANCNWEKYINQRIISFSCQAKYNQQLKDKVYAAYGGYCCKSCSNINSVVLTLDHVWNDGYQHRKLIGGKIYQWAKKNNYPNSLQVLCRNCQLLKLPRVIK